MPEVTPLDVVSIRTDSQQENEQLPQVMTMQKETAACWSMQPLRLGDEGFEFDAKTPCFSGSSGNVVLPVVLKLLESSVFCELVSMWSVLDLEQQQLVFDAVREQARQLGRMTG